MMQFRQKRVWFWIAALALLAAVVLMLMPHAESGHSGTWLAILPIFFVGLVSPLVLLVSVTCLRVVILPAAPPLPSAFQRPPPSRRG